jgi:aromatic ring-cleaving dioxygenase
MHQVAFLPSQFGKVVPWLMLHREGLDILVHPETGDDLADHTLHSLWLGQKLELNVEFLRPRTTNASLRSIAPQAKTVLGTATMGI